MVKELEPGREGYDAFLRDLKNHIRAAQIRTGLAINRALIPLYRRIGRQILTRQQPQAWGAKVIQRLAADLRQAFPAMQRWAARNLHYMRAFAEAYPDELFVQQPAAQVPCYGCHAPPWLARRPSNSAVGS